PLVRMWGCLWSSWPSAYYVVPRIRPRVSEPFWRNVRQSTTGDNLQVGSLRAKTTFQPERSARLSTKNFGMEHGQKHASAFERTAAPGALELQGPLFTIILG